MENAEAVHENFKALRSISDAEKRLTDWDPDDNSEDLPTFIINSISNGEKQSELRIIGNSSQYHNLASEFARKSLYRYAAEVARIGVIQYKYNVDLLADLIKYSSQYQAWDASKKAYDRLREISFEKWTWRCFTFSIDYLFDLIEVSELDQTNTIIKEIELLIAAFKNLKDERAWVAEADLNLKKGKRKQAIASLKNGIKNVVVSPQCCIKLGDLLLEDGIYDEVVKYASIGIRATAQDQPTASVAYLFYISALAKDARIHKEAQEEKMASCDSDGIGFQNISAVKDALLDYSTAKRLFMGTRNTYQNNIDQRVSILKAKSGMESIDEENSFNKMIAESLVEKMLQKNSDGDIG